MTRLAVPEEALNKGIAIIGKTGSGKSHAAKGLVEHLLRAERRVCIIDPTSVWWGLRSSADGKRPGFPIVVFGGDKAAVPINDQSGDALAEIVAAQNLPSVIDVSEMTMGGRTRFMTAFLEKLYAKNRLPLNLIIDEAEMFAPQQPMPDQTVMLSRMEQIARRGRVRGFRLWQITQRPASLHKSVLSQADTLIAMKLVSPQDRNALGDWIKGQADVQEGKDVLADLPKLPRGTGWVWVPEQGILQRTEFPELTTFDSGRTPEHADAAIAPPQRLADVDVSGLVAALADTAAEAKANDPKTLHRRIHELEQQIERIEAKPQELAVDTAALEAAFIKGIAEGAERFRQAFEDWLPKFVMWVRDFEKKCGETIEQMRESAKQAAQRPDGTPLDIKFGGQRVPFEAINGAHTNAMGYGAPRTVQSKPPARRAEPTDAGDSIAGTRMSRAMLTALAQRGTLTKGQILLFTGYRSSGPVSKAFAALTREGLIESDGNRVQITGAGRDALGDYMPLPTGAALRQHILGESSQMERAFLDVLFSVYPKSIAKGVLLERTGYKSSGPVSKVFAKIAAINYAVKVGGGMLKASDDLFEGVRS